MRVGAIDCGTNSIRLLITEAADDAVGASPAEIELNELVRTKEMVRLGQGVDATGWLAQEALERTFAAVDGFARLLDEHAVDSVRFVATSATRDAGNRHVFVDGIRSRLGVAPEVISGEEEAALSFAGATMVAAPESEDDRTMVVDLGGGSTELVLGSSAGILASRSLNIGCVRMTERHLGSNPPTEAQQRAVLADVDRALDSAALTVPLGQTRKIVGVAGTVTTITALALGLEEYDEQRINGAELPISDLERTCRELTAMTREQRDALGVMHPGRGDVIGGGALVWRRVLQRIAEATDERVSTATTSEHDILDGIALSRLSTIPQKAPLA